METHLQTRVPPAPPLRQRAQAPYPAIIQGNLVVLLAAGTDAAPARARARAPAHPLLAGWSNFKILRRWPANLYASTLLQNPKHFNEISLGNTKVYGTAP